MGRSEWYLILNVREESVRNHCSEEGAYRHICRVCWNPDDVSGHGQVGSVGDEKSNQHGECGEEDAVSECIHAEKMPQLSL